MACIPNWTSPNISTLKLLQIVHRHGDRAPISFAPKDKFNTTKYWPEGFEQLTIKGKYRMNKVGEFIRKAYQQYLGDQYSPREVYARSSGSTRALESISCFLSGAYPPNNSNNTFTWAHAGSDGDIPLGKLWQPIPIQTIATKDETLLLGDKSCPNADKDKRNISNSEQVKSAFEAKKQFLNDIKNWTGEEINTLAKAQRLWDTLMIETDWNYHWIGNNISEQIEVVNKLQEDFSRLLFRTDWATPLLKRVRAGKLIETLVTNMADSIANKGEYKLFVYSTHDGIVAPLLQAMDVYNDMGVPFAATLIVELHHNSSDGYFVRLYYYNETNVLPYLLPFASTCNMETFCEFNEFRKNMQQWYYSDFDKECGISVLTFLTGLSRT